MGDVPSNQPTFAGEATVDKDLRLEKHYEANRSEQPDGIVTSIPSQAPSILAANRAQQAPRSGGPEYYSGSRGFIVQNSQAVHAQPMNMSDVCSAISNYQPPAIPFGQRGMFPHYIAAAQSQGIPYSMTSFHAYPVSQIHGTVSYGITYTQPYSIYTQQQSPLQTGAPAYQSYIQDPSALQGLPLNQAPIYGPFYTQQPYIATTRHDPVTSGLPARPQSGLGQNSTLAPSKAPTGPRKDGDQRTFSPAYDVARTIVDGSNMRSARSQHDINPRNQSHTGTSTPSTPSTPRGPPRKPKQSGHALWVGNLPPGVGVVDLKDHFSRDATDDIESVFLISKSNCAFVNYKTDEACTAALTRFHDSRFKGIRLVCRLRKGLTMPGSNMNFASVTTTGGRETEKTKSSPTDQEPDNNEDVAPASSRSNTFRVTDRYFIVKSLTVDDLELSRQSGIWATQTHNEAALNQAFETADNVYLIFSANKSGEYFGYGRMVSSIQEDENLALEMPPRPDFTEGDNIHLQVTQTEASSTAPKGHIIEDSARGTIFWEADSSGDEEDDKESEQNDTNTASEVPTEPHQPIGKPFRIEWLSTERVPFYRTRGLRNRWNSNREVKIARDGTELEPSVGRKLIQLFHTQASGELNSAVSASGGQAQGYQTFQAPY